MWTYVFLFSSLVVAGDTLLPHRASVISSTCRTDNPAKYLSLKAFSTLPRTSSLSCPLPLDNSLLLLYTIFSDMVCFLLLEWYVVTLFYKSSASHVFSFAFL